MLARIRKAKEENEGGFTLIELLVVIIIIGILAAIAIPVFLSQREKGWVAQVESDLKKAATSVESYATGANGSYVSMNGQDEAGALLRAEGFRGSEGVSVDVIAGANSYCINATHGSLGTRSFVYSSADGIPTEAAACTAAP